MSPREARQKWRDLTTAGKALWAGIASLPALAAGWLLVSGFLSLPRRMDAAEAQVRKNTAYIDQNRALNTFLACAEIARQQHREDPKCLQDYFARQTGSTP